LSDKNVASFVFFFELGEKKLGSIPVCSVNVVARQKGKGHDKSQVDIGSGFPKKKNNKPGYVPKKVSGGWDERRTEAGRE